MATVNCPKGSKQLPATCVALTASRRTTQQNQPRRNTVNNRIGIRNALLTLAAMSVLVPGISLAADPDDYPAIITPAGTCEFTPALLAKEIRKGRCSIVDSDERTAKVNCKSDPKTFLMLFSSMSVCEKVRAKLFNN